MLQTGDSAETLASQYDLEQAEAITDTEGDEKIKKDTEVSGDKVEEVTDNEILTLDMSSELATDQRVFDQFLFATDYSAINKGKFDFLPSNYFDNRPISLDPYVGFTNLNGNKLKFRITLYNPNPYSKWSDTNEFPISNYVDEPDQPSWGYENVLMFYRTTNNPDKPAQSDGAKIYFNNTRNSNSIKKRFKR